jgi:coenzyme F420-dependent glucose-6-phosphate dehydrogenase
MAFIGFHAAHEQLGPRELLDLALRAEHAGFRDAMCSDHFHPWSETRGQSGFSWSWLGAALQATSMSFGTVCAPGQRYHPAIIAQAAATLAEMYPGRFWLAVGTGEALNESITGDPWPMKEERQARLLECVDVMRRLWAGETVTHRGRVRVREARLFTRPAIPPLLLGAALSVETAAWVGGWADGLLTCSGPSDSFRRIIEAFRAGGGHAKPVYGQAAVCYAPTESEAMESALQGFRHGGLEPALLSDLPTPRAFDAASQQVTPERLRQCVRISSDLGRHEAWVRGDFACGATGLYLNHVGRHVDRFIDLIAHRLSAATGDAPCLGAPLRDRLTGNGRVVEVADSLSRTVD